MRRSTDRILSTHGGNLPRPKALDALIAQQPRPAAEIEASLPGAVQSVVDKQIECGVTVINDGEYVKAANAASYSGYIHSRVTGYEMLPKDPTIPPKRGGVAARDAKDFPGVLESGLWLSGAGGPVRPGFAIPGAKMPVRTTERVCTGPIAYTGHAAIAEDIAALKAALVGKPDVDGFIAALGPLSLAAGVRNTYYPSETAYMTAVAEALREEYKAITDAGLIVQIDEPEFATTWSFYPDWEVKDLRRFLNFAAEIINHAIEGLPQEQIRFHMCWGSGHRPHVNDIGLEHIADIMLKINAQAYSVESGNVRHAHEWKLWKDIGLPDGKILVPGVVSHATDLVEHPELVAERLCNFASILGMENIQAGTDCGIGSRVGHEEIVWAKLKAMSEGCEIAYKRLRSH